MYMYTYGFCISNGKSSQLALTEPSHLHLPTPPCETDERHAAEGHLQSDQKAPGAACLTGKEHVEITSHGDGSKPMKYLWNTYEIPMKYLWNTYEHLKMNIMNIMNPWIIGWGWINTYDLYHLWGDEHPSIPVLWVLHPQSHAEPCGAQTVPHWCPKHPPPAPRPFFGTLPSQRALRVRALRFLRPRRSRVRSAATRGRGWRASARWCRRGPGGPRPWSHGTPWATGLWLLHGYGIDGPIFRWSNYLWRWWCSIAILEYLRLPDGSL